MQKKLLFLILTLVLLFSSCIKKQTERQSLLNLESSNSFLSGFTPADGINSDEAEDIQIYLDGITELERSGSYFPGLAFSESGLRERAGDFAGAVIATYKELSFAYSHGRLDEEELGQSISSIYNLFSGDNGLISPDSRENAVAAIRGVLAFNSELWDEAESFLSKVHTVDNDPDSFLNWMLLVCALEKGTVAENRTKRSAYGSIRARYTSFPEYWYRGAGFYRDASSYVPSFGIRSEENIASIYAEQCINLSPDGPYAGRSREIIAQGMGLTDAGESIKTKIEIDNIIRLSISEENPEYLIALFNLITLPDNAYTSYAVELLKTMSMTAQFRGFFEREALESNGRLAERLRYISRG